MHPPRAQREFGLSTAVNFNPKEPIFPSPQSPFGSSDGSHSTSALARGAAKYSRYLQLMQLALPSRVHCQHLPKSALIARSAASMAVLKRLQLGLTISSPDRSIDWTGSLR